MSRETARNLVREQAFERFEGSRAEYESRLHEWLVEKQRGEILKAAIKDGVPAAEEGGPVPSHQYRACLIRALKNILLKGDCSLGAPIPYSIKLPDGLYDVDAARVFVRSNWETVGRLAWEARSKVTGS